jgi:hypothetical protein
VGSFAGIAFAPSAGLLDGLIVARRLAGYGRRDNLTATRPRLL